MAAKHCVMLLAISTFTYTMHKTHDGWSIKEEETGYPARQGTLAGGDEGGCLH